MRYVVSVRPEALADFLLQQFPPELEQCVEARLAALAEDPEGLSEPCQFPYPAGYCYPFQCEPAFLTAVCDYDPQQPTLDVKQIHVDRRGS